LIFFSDCGILKKTGFFMKGKFMIVDFHTHVFPDAIAGKTVAHLAALGHLAPYGRGTREDLLADMRKSGVSLSLNLPVATKPSQFATINRFAEELNRSGCGIISFGGIHPDDEDPEGELDELVARGFRGIKLHPDYQGVYIDDPRYCRIIAAALRRDLSIVIHAGLDVAYPDDIHCTPSAARRMLDRVQGEIARSRGRIVLAHLGGNERYDEVERELAGQNICLDLAFIIRHAPRDQMLRIIRTHGADRILFGSDYPWSDPGADIASLRSLPLSESELRAILSENAMKLLGMHE
jgi:predicted TIM-barrel fold metal-dependent hydrolase